MTRASRFEIDPQPVQHIRAPGDLGRFEGVAFSPSGKLLAVAASDANVVFIYRRNRDGQFEDTPGQRLGGKLGFPHDVAFSHCGRLLAVAERRGAVTLYGTDRAGDSVGPEPVFEISGPDSKLDFSDGAAFVPPDDRYLAVCITLQGIIAFFKRRTPAGFEGTPEFELRHPSISDPDGLAFSTCGRWLALANHGNHSATVFRRRSRFLTGGKLQYGPEPVARVEDPQMRHPHSVAFTPAGHLVVTNSSSNNFYAFREMSRPFRTSWSQPAAQAVVFGEQEKFIEVNSQNPLEGGPKGIAIHGNTMAVCNPEYGVKIYSFRE